MAISEDNFELLKLNQFKIEGIMRRFLTTMYVIASSILLCSCISCGVNLSTHVTQVGLKVPNYQMVARSVSGSATVEGVLGVSYGFGLGASQLSLIPMSDNRTVYKTAMENLWSDFETDHGSIAGRKLALANMRYDSETLNTFFYTKLTVEVIADVVEFED